jgi:hypothetical protein
MMINLIAAIVISLSVNAAHPGDQFTLTATVQGPYEGPVCFAIGDDSEQKVISQGCFDEPLDLEKGESDAVEKELHVPASAHSGDYRFVAYLPHEEDEDKRASEPVILKVE